MVWCLVLWLCFHFCYCRSTSWKQFVLEGMRGLREYQREASGSCWRERRRGRASPKEDQSEVAT